jgi:hypothetical protein
VCSSDLEDAEKLRTVGDALGYLNQKVGA